MENEQQNKELTLEEYLSIMEIEDWEYKVRKESIDIILDSIRKGHEVDFATNNFGCSFRNGKLTKKIYW